MLHSFPPPIRRQALQAPRGIAREISGAMYLLLVCATVGFAQEAAPKQPEPERSKELQGYLQKCSVALRLDALKAVPIDDQPSTQAVADAYRKLDAAPKQTLDELRDDLPNLDVRRAIEARIVDQGEKANAEMRKLLGIDPQIGKALTNRIKHHEFLFAAYRREIQSLDSLIGNRQSKYEIEWFVMSELDGVPWGVALQAGLLNIKKLSEKFAQEYGGTPGEVNALQHAMWQALLAFRYGVDDAKVIGDVHETLQQFGDDQRRRDSKADLANNIVGRDIGVQVLKDHGGMILRNLPVDEIRTKIIEAFRNGQLDVDGGVGGPGVSMKPGDGQIHKPTR